MHYQKLHCFTPYIIPLTFSDSFILCKKRMNDTLYFFIWLCVGTAWWILVNTTWWLNIKSIPCMSLNNRIFLIYVVIILIFQTLLAIARHQAIICNILTSLCPCSILRWVWVSSSLDMNPLSGGATVCSRKTFSMVYYKIKIPFK